MRTIMIVNGNWADEMDLAGFIILSKEDEDYLSVVIERYPEILGERFTWFVGTNEDTFYSMSGNFTGKEITDLEAESIKSTLDTHGRYSLVDYFQFGSVPNLMENVRDYVSERMKK